MVSFFKDNPELSSKLALVPSFEDKGMLFSLFAIPLLFGWWSVYYPGAEPGGGGYLVQRMLAAKDEQHALGATLFFNIAHYALRPWPWIIVALCSMIVFPLSTNSEVAATISAKQAIVEIAKKAETSPTKVWDYVDELAKEKGFNKEAKVNVEVITLKSLINLEMDDAKALVSGLKVFHPLTQTEKNKFIEVLLKENNNAKNNKESLDLVTRAKTQLNFVNKGVFFLRAAFDKDRVPDDKLGHDLGYSAMLNFLPHGWLGLILTSLVAAYMSTISTHLNWGSSYVVNDFYLRFIKPEASPRELVWVGRISTVVLMIITAIFALQLQNAMQLFKILLSVGAGTGLLLILRWFWWRINALSEITALIVSFFASVILQVLIPKYAPELSESFNNIIPNVNSGDFTFLLIVLITTISWVSVTLFTKPTDNEKLYKFCEKINPAGPGWNAVYNSAEKDGVKIVSKHEKENIPFSLLCMILGVLLVYGFLFATGYWIYDNTVPAIISSVVSLISGVLLVILWKKISADKAAPSSE
jgi:Na+/proline symporter